MHASLFMKPCHGVLHSSKSGGEFVIAAFPDVAQCFVKDSTRSGIRNEWLVEFNAPLVGELLQLLIHHHRERHADFLGDASRPVAHVLVYLKAHGSFHITEVYTTGASCQ